MKNYVLSAVVATVGLFGAHAESSAEKPNILFILADDQCYDTIHALGNPEIQTPSLDRLVERGTSFSNTYNMGAWGAAVCVASRAMLNTGRSVWHAGCMYGDPRIDPDFKFPLKGKVLDREKMNFNMIGEAVMTDAFQQGELWSQQMKAAGYETYMSGKWHVQHVKPEQVFDTTQNVRGGMPRTTQDVYKRKYEPGVADVWSPSDETLNGYWQGGTHWSEVLANDAEAFIDQAKESDKPFFMYLAFNAPHDPRQAPQRFVDMYPVDKIKLPESFLPENPCLDPMGCPKNLRDEMLAPFPRTEYSVKVNIQEYYALISHMDEQIGRMLDALEASGEWDNTYIFFTADHGLAVGKHGLMGKQSMFEHSMRPPLLLVGPGVPANNTVDGNVYLQDVMPTSLELAGAPVPKYVYFKSLLPVLRGEREGNYSRVYGSYMHRQRMIVEDGYKLILYPKSGTVLLYNLEKDPQELTDLAGKFEYATLKKKLFRSFLELQEELDDPLDIKGIYSDLM